MAILSEGGCVPEGGEGAQIHACEMPDRCTLRVNRATCCASFPIHPDKRTSPQKDRQLNRTGDEGGSRRWSPAFPSLASGGSRDIVRLPCRGRREIRLDVQRPRPEGTYHASSAEPPDVPASGAHLRHTVKQKPARKGKPGPKPRPKKERLDLFKIYGIAHGPCTTFAGL